MTIPIPRTLLTNGWVVTGGERPRVIPDGAVAFRERVEAVGPREELERKHPTARRLDAHGGLVLPGLVNLHHHFYSALARGLDPGPGLTSFPEVLRRLWWRLDRALRPDEICFSALLSLAESIRAGTTTVFDHHASPSCIPGILEVIAAAVEEAGLSGVLCYEVTDRNGHAGAREGLLENARHIEEYRSHARIRGMLGLHASFTLSDGTLAEVRDLAGAGVHVHVAEDPVDGSFSRSAFGKSPLERLEGAGLLGPRALLVHGVHLEPEALRLVARSGSVLAHSPESNAHNGVGRLDVLRAAREGCALGLGTDGMSSSMLRALRAAFLQLRGGERDPTAGFAVLPSLLATNARIAALFFDEPLLGSLEPGAPADIAVFEAPPPTPLSEANLFAHLVYGAAEAPVRHTIARGRILQEDFRRTTLDVNAIAREARRHVPALWARLLDLDTETPFVGALETTA